MKIALGSDHAGFELKETLKGKIAGLGHEVVDLGAHTYDALDDYPDFAEKVGKAVAAKEVDRGIVICGSGVGASIAANKIVGVRAATVTDVTTAHLCREHNHANVICFGARLTGEAVVLESVDAFLAAVPGGDRHLRRVEKLSFLEASQPTP